MSTRYGTVERRAVTVRALYLGVDGLSPRPGPLGVNCRALTFSMSWGLLAQMVLQLIVGFSGLVSSVFACDQLMTSLQPSAFETAACDGEGVDFASRRAQRSTMV